MPPRKSPPMPSSNALPPSSAQQSSPTPRHNTSASNPKRVGYKYRLQPDWTSPPSPSSGCHHYVFYAAGWAGNPAPAPPPFGHRARPQHVDDADLEARYAPDWFDGFVDWTERADRAVYEAKLVQKQRGVRGTVGSGIASGSGPFADDGERVLWAVEGLLLACWLCLQPDVEAVEYRPAADAWTLDKGNVGDVAQRFLTALRV
ncbi:hypothetical protein B0T24DRAFT_640341 [Lasiosphaeria ovina]|uniref:Uncharacterized protein n=1 Tax=Lasiosphaeria ovina TaxID=92902 RepID=A0AAE0JU51_9PEZI|nr:hypothetical protein B0T24DRAFT_640341 [Lasiosphaeria ovina]